MFFSLYIFSLLFSNPYNVAKTFQLLAMSSNVSSVLSSDKDTDNNVSEWQVLENFVKSLVEDWRYQARVGPVTYGLLVIDTKIFILKLVVFILSDKD